jgi:hypothetical protein
MTPMSDRETYLIDWAKQLGIKPDPGFEWKICETLINKRKNYDTAAAVMFELSWRWHRDYLLRAVAALTEWHKQAGCCVVSGNDLYTFVDYYIHNTEELPKKTAE